MTNECKVCVCQLNNLAALCNRAAVEAAKGNWARVTDLLQGEVTPMLQTVAHDAWLKHRQSGSGKA